MHLWLLCNMDGVFVSQCVFFFFFFFEGKEYPQAAGMRPKKMPEDADYLISFDMTNTAQQLCQIFPFAW